MAKFVSLINWTDEGAKTASATVDRADAAKKMAADMGGSIEVLWTMGEYDIVAISEFADDETAVKFLAKISARWRDPHVDDASLRRSTRCGR